MAFGSAKRIYLEQRSNNDEETVAVQVTKTEEELKKKEGKTMYATRQELSYRLESQTS